MKAPDGSAGTNERGASWKALLPWVALIGLLAIPLYVLSVVLVVRSGFLDLRDRSVSDEQFKAVWAFVASGLAAGVTLVGTLLTQSASKRTELLQREAQRKREQLDSEVSQRQTLEVVVKGLDLISQGPDYAPKAKVAGGLTTMVLLNEAVVAMRVLSTVWEEGKVDLGTAMWLIDAVLKSGDEASEEEAAQILSDRAASLTGTDESGVPYALWPRILLREWPSRLTRAAKQELMWAFENLIRSQKRHWWSGVSVDWALYVLDEAVTGEEEAEIKARAVGILEPLLTLHDEIWPDVPIQGWEATSPDKSSDDIWRRCREFKERHPGLAESMATWNSMQSWARDEDVQRAAVTST